jgi:hypothetical protein
MLKQRRHIGKLVIGNWIRQAGQKHVRSGFGYLGGAHGCLDLSQIGGSDDGYVLEARVIASSLDFGEMAIHV